MPFKNKFKPGDLVYGLKSGRRYYFGAVGGFPRCHMDALLTGGAILTIDQYAVSPYSLAQQTRFNLSVPLNQNDFISVLLTHPKYASIVNSEFSFDRKEITRKCKGGLYWVSTLKDDTTVHYILDGIDFHRMLNSSVSHQKSITDSELRWIFRNRHNPQVQKHVQFWLNGLPTTPPWTWTDGTEQLWAEYDIRRLQSPHRPM